MPGTSCALHLCGTAHLLNVYLCLWMMNPSHSLRVGVEFSMELLPQSHCGSWPALTAALGGTTETMLSISSFFQTSGPGQLLAAVEA